MAIEKANTSSNGTQPQQLSTTNDTVAADNTAKGTEIAQELGFDVVTEGEDQLAVDPNTGERYHLTDLALLEDARRQERERFAAGPSTLTDATDEPGRQVLTVPIDTTAAAWGRGGPSVYARVYKDEFDAEPELAQEAVMDEGLVALDVGGLEPAAQFDRYQELGYIDPSRAFVGMDDDGSFRSVDQEEWDALPEWAQSVVMTDGPEALDMSDLSPEEEFHRLQSYGAIDSMLVFAGTDEEGNFLVDESSPLDAPTAVVDRAPSDHGQLAETMVEERQVIEDFRDIGDAALGAVLNDPETPAAEYAEAYRELLQRQEERRQRALKLQRSAGEQIDEEEQFGAGLSALSDAVLEQIISSPEANAFAPMTVNAAQEDLDRRRLQRQELLKRVAYEIRRSAPEQIDEAGMPDPYVAWLIARYTDIDESRPFVPPVPGTPPELIPSAINDEQRADDIRAISEFVESARNQEQRTPSDDALRETDRDALEIMVLDPEASEDEQRAAQERIERRDAPIVPRAPASARMDASEDVGAKLEEYEQRATFVASEEGRALAVEQQAVEDAASTALFGRGERLNEIREEESKPGPSPQPAPTPSPVSDGPEFVDEPAREREDHLKADLQALEHAGVYKPYGGPSVGDIALQLAILGATSFIPVGALAASAGRGIGPFLKVLGRNPSTRRIAQLLTDDPYLARVRAVEFQPPNAVGSDGIARITLHSGKVIEIPGIPAGGSVAATRFTTRLNTQLSTRDAPGPALGGQLLGQLDDALEHSIKGSLQTTSPLGVPFTVIPLDPDPVLEPSTAPSEGPDEQPGTRPGTPVPTTFPVPEPGPGQPADEPSPSREPDRSPTPGAAPDDEPEPVRQPDEPDTQRTLIPVPPIPKSVPIPDRGIPISIPIPRPSTVTTYITHRAEPTSLLRVAPRVTAAQHQLTQLEPIEEPAPSIEPQQRPKPVPLKTETKTDEGERSSSSRPRTRRPIPPRNEGAPRGRIDRRKMIEQQLDSYPEIVAYREPGGLWRTVDIDTGETVVSPDPPAGIPPLAIEGATPHETYTVLSRDGDPPSQRTLDLGGSRVTVGEGLHIQRRRGGQRGRKQRPRRR